MSIMSIVSSVSSKASSGILTGSQKAIDGFVPVSWYQIQCRTLLLYLLPCLSILGACGTLFLGRSNGTFTRLEGYLEKDPPRFPVTENTEHPLVASFTGLGLVDGYLKTLVIFFAPTMELSSGSLPLFCFFTFGQFGAAWTLMVMESLRLGNKRRIVSYVGTIGLIAQLITFTITIPLWLLLHLFTSAVAKPFPGSHANSVLLVPTLDLRILPFSVTLGYVIPSVLMMIPAPSIISSSNHQRLIAFWQAFPIWTMAIHFSFAYLCKYISHRLASRNSNQTPKPQGTSYLHGVKYPYLFILTLCIFTHIPVLLIALTPIWSIPNFFPIHPILSRLAAQDIFSVYLPYIPYISQQASSYSMGVRYFLQWDLYIGSVALLFWATFLYRNATEEKTLVDPNTSLPSYHYREILAGEGRWKDHRNLWRKIGWKILWWTNISGPIGALTILLWERDYIVRQKIKQGI